MAESLDEGVKQTDEKCTRIKISIGKFLVFAVLFALLTVLVINVYVSAYSQKYIIKDLTQTPFKSSSSTPVALVLGASVYSDGTLSPMLEERAKTAFDLYKKGMVQKVLVSGDNRAPTYNEVMPIRKYLLDSGVPTEDIFTDFAGLNTYDSMYRAHKIFGVEDVLVVSQSFHLPRAIYAARNIGLNAYGISADIEGSYFRNNTREIFATAKTFLKVVTGAQSLFLGREIPIEGDGRDSLR